MRAHYEFSSMKGRRNPYLGLLKHPVTIRLDRDTVAYFKVHFPRGFWPILNGGELAVLYSFLFLYIATHGSGKWSLDRLLERWVGGRHSA